METFWQIREFSKVIGKHHNTVDGWFKQMEERRLHYINRAGHEKVYDELDLQIARYIYEWREKGWSLEGIFGQLAEHCELRPFPKDYDLAAQLQAPSIDVIKNQLVQEMRTAFEEVAAAQLKELERMYEQWTVPELPLHPLPLYPSRLELRKQRLADVITRKRIEIQLEQTALHLWSTKPASERLRRVGLFRKEENREMRELFVKSYVNKYFADRVRDELDWMELHWPEESAEQQEIH
ncbi:hypothetical protein [Paenibacillus rigui]|uniref:MerR family transcriptional regulator n=1 Tax=Paenibacillus rigui TaxID=554312 RepID=A0A229UJT8_9BACL|nr:hypothetical protein [Paenibacillus rigui]OXM83575.1 MerR family transcriptional regulator [Paenibacillus rigui]